MSQVVLITGTRKGIGKVLAEHFLARGCKVAGCSREPGTVMHENYLHFTLDVSSEAAVVAMVREVKRSMGPISVLLNNAGIASMNHFLVTPVKSFKDLFNTNVGGTFLFTREVSKIMMGQKYGRIVNFTTVAVPLNLKGEAMYASSKSAIETMTRISAKELGSYGITVNAIGPTPVKTDLIKAVPQSKLDELLDSQAIRRFGEFRDVLNAVDFFVNPASDFITGQVLYLGGVF